MVASPLFEGTLEELYRRRDEFAGIRLAVFAAPVKETEHQTQSRRPEEVKTPERLVELLLDGLASPARDMTAMDWSELKCRAASGRTSPDFLDTMIGIHADSPAFEEVTHRIHEERERERNEARRRSVL